MSKKYLGVDIRSNGLSAVILKGGMKGSWIEDYRYIPFDDSGNEENGNPLSKALQVVAEEMDISDSTCIASIPADKVYYRNVQTPFKDPKKIRQILPFELETMLPRAIDDLVIDFHLIKRKDQDDNDRADIIAVSAEKPVLKSYLETFSSRKIDPEIVSVGSYTTALCVSRLADIPEKWIFLDIEETHCTLYLFISDQIHLTRTFPISFKNTPTPALTYQVRHTISAFENFFGMDFEPEKLYISGYNPDDIDIDNAVSEALDLPVVRTDIITESGSQLTPNPERPWDKARMSTAFSLAYAGYEGIDGLNLRKGPFSVRKYWAEHRSSLITSGILLFLVLFLAFLNVYFETNTLKQRVNDLDTQMNRIFQTTFPEVTKIVDPVRQMQAAIEEKKQTALFPGENKQYVRTIDILQTISDHIPQNLKVKLERMVISEGVVQITGNTDTFNAVDEMKNQLTRAKLFRKVTISSANIERDGTGVQFKLKIEI